MASSLSLVCLLLCLRLGRVWAASHREQLSCDSWRFNVEVNNLKSWKVVPDRCEHYVASYMRGPAYHRDSEAATLAALAYAHDFLINASNKTSPRYCWVFDVDETSLSNLPFYQHQRFGVEAYNDTLFGEWVEIARAPAIPTTLLLVHKLQKLGYSIIFLTGRYENQRAMTEKNLASVGYKGWIHLFLRLYIASKELMVDLCRQEEEHDLIATLYKSKKRKELEDMGYIIVGNVGDQWSDLTGYSIGHRVFKLPNPMYYIS